MFAVLIFMVCVSSNLIRLHFANCTFSEASLFTSLIERLTLLADRRIFMDPYRTSYSNKFPLHLNTNFYTTEFDRESHLDGGVLNLQ